MNVRIYTLMAIAGLSVFALAPGVASYAASAGGYGTNLVVNGDAESGPGSPSSGTVVKPKSWITTGQTSAMQYGASGGFPDAKSPGPPNRGKNLFEGGNIVKSSAAQTISLAQYAADIDAGHTAFAFSAWIGGYSTQNDNATVSVSFMDAAKAPLGGATLGPVMASERKNATSLVQRSAKGEVPKGARTAIVTMTFNRTEGTYNDGSVDDVSLVLNKTP
jgi:hypothetical protein